LILVLTMVLKKGLLERSWAALTGRTLAEDEWDEVDGPFEAEEA
jgi:hypothetical protein